MTGVLRRLGIVLAIVLAVALVAGCGLPEDGSPRALGDDQIPPELAAPASTTTTTIAEALTEPASIYLLNAVEEQLVLNERARDVPSPVADADVIASLIAGSTEDEQETLGLTSAIPEETMVIETIRDEPTLTINLGSTGLAELEGDTQRAAIAQLVYTATALAGISNVRIQIEGEFRPLPTDTGDTGEVETVTRNDYRSFDPEALTAGS